MAQTANAAGMNPLIPRVHAGGILVLRSLVLVLVGQAVGVVGTGTNPNLGGGAHEVLVVGTFGALTGAYRGQDLR